MIDQRAPHAAPVLRATAEDLPFPDGSFDAALAVLTVLVPYDCLDGFGAAFWARPEAYLDPDVQAGMSWLALLPEADRQEGTRRLRADLDSGDWDRRLGHLRTQEEYDGGYRLAVAGEERG